MATTAPTSFILSRRRLQLKGHYGRDSVKYSVWATLGESQTDLPPWDAMMAYEAAFGDLVLSFRVSRSSALFGSGGFEGQHGDNACHRRNPVDQADTIGFERLLTPESSQSLVWLWLRTNAMRAALMGSGRFGQAATTLVRSEGTSWVSI